MKADAPFIYWVAAPLHTSFSYQRSAIHTKFNLSLDSVIHTKENMRVIRLKEFWNTKQGCLVVNDRITEEGISRYWRAVDASVKFNVLCREAFLAK